MSENLPKYKQLTVISDTALSKKGNETYGFGPVVRELEYIAPIFEKIVWVGFDRSDEVGSRAFDRIRAKNIETVLLKKCGGDYFSDKLKVMLNTPVMILKIIKNLYKADVVHTRSPSSPAFIALLLSYLFRKKIWWNKYAGNWNQKHPPFFYGLQRNLLKTAKHTKVTINGLWADQPGHCFSFENPCLTNEQIEIGKKAQSKKFFDAPFRLAFVGRIEEEKGIKRIIEALKIIDLKSIKRIDFVGNGKYKDEYEKQLFFIKDKIFFHGFLDNNGVHNILYKSDFLILPSTASEGFPKVIAEAACYGCIPIVSDVSCIGQYIKEVSNGFLWEINGSDPFPETLKKALLTSSENLKEKSANCLLLAEKFTFDNYRYKLKTSILTKL